MILACFPVYLLNTTNDSFMFFYVTVWSCRGALMDDAMILPCGHSFGGGGMQHVIKLVCLAVYTSIYQTDKQFVVYHLVLI